MNRKQLLPFIGIAVLCLIVGIGLGRCGNASGDSPSAGSGQATDAHDHSAEAAPTIWTCSMHPQIQQPGPGKCPICGMDLIPLETGSTDDAPATALTMSRAAMALAEVQTTEVVRELPTAEVRLVGSLAYDETRVKSITARFPARIEELFVNYVGVPVKAGEHLCLVYSPELLTAQRELITSAQADPSGAITEATREKLRLWGLLPEQIDGILKSGTPSDRFELKSPLGGIVIQKDVNEGDYVKTGSLLFKIVDLSNLWLFLDAYETDLAWLRYGQKVSFTVQAYPGETFGGTISFIEPEMNISSRTVRIRVDVPNPDGALKPGMFAKALVRAQLAAGGQVYVPDLAGKWICPMHPDVVEDGPGQCPKCHMDLVPADSLGFVKASEDDGKAIEAPLVIPASAVLQTGKRAVVYVQLPNQEQPTFEAREIVLGPKAGDVYLVAEGLQEGETVVTHGAFKIDSSLQIQAKPSMMSGKVPMEETPKADMSGMNMGNKKADESTVVVHELYTSWPESESDVEHIAPAAIAKLLPDYFKLQNALANDNLALAQMALKAMKKQAGDSEALATLLGAMLAAKDIDGIRQPYFQLLSELSVGALKQDPSAYDGAVYEMFCPMADNGAGAPWLQDNDTLANPYFGQMMSTCGEARGTLGSKAK